MKRADSAIYHIVKDMGMEDALKLHRINKLWNTLFQEPLSLHTSPSRLSKGQLVINVDSPVWLQEISFYKADIIKKLSRFGVKDIRLKGHRPFLNSIGKAAKNSDGRGPRLRPGIDPAGKGD